MSDLTAPFPYFGGKRAVADLSQDARDLLPKASRQTVVLGAGDPRWRAAGKLQRANLVRLKWGAHQFAELVLTDKGRDALRVAREGDRA